MPYSLNEVRSFFEKDAKYNIGMGVGNAFNKAVDVVVAQGVEGFTRPMVLEKVLPLRDMFFNENQGKIEFEVNEFLKSHSIKDWYEEAKAKDEEIKEAVTPVIDAGVSL